MLPFPAGIWACWALHGHWHQQMMATLQMLHDKYSTKDESNRPVLA